VVVAEAEGPPTEWEGCRLCLQAERIETKGELLEEFRKQAAEAAGRETAHLLQAFITPKLTDMRPLLSICNQAYLCLD